jgi:uncharacterized protein (TIGR03000 family)
MYSVILMAAMGTGTTEAPNWMLRGLVAHNSCYGCWGSCYGCCGGCYGCCYGGCCGGCWGGYYSSTCYGWGSYYGGGGFCLGGGCYGGCWGSCYGYGWGSYAYPAYAPPPAYSYPAPAAPVAPPIEKAPAPKPAGIGQAVTAKIVVEVPADARLYIDGQLMRTAGIRRTYSTPQLETGQKYFYDMRVESVRDGEPVTENRRVILQAGDVIEASFRDLTIARKKVPEGPISVATYRQP